MLLKQKNVFFKMEKTQNSLPGINNHNDFAKIIKNLFHDDFVFNYCWHEKYYCKMCNSAKFAVSSVLPDDF